MPYTAFAQTVFSSLEVNGRNPISSINEFYNLVQLKNDHHAAIVYQPGTPQELMFGFHSNGSFYWGSRAISSYPMVLSGAGDLKIAKSFEATGTGSVNGNLSIKSNGSTSSELLMYKQNGGYYDVGASNSGFFIFNSSNNQHLMKANENNELAIGTNPVAGSRLAVGGSIIAEAVKVKLQSQWPDYVFDSSYKRLSLKELDEFVRREQHLPEMPVAEDVKENGIDLGEMNSKLLRKVEELTLYLIEQGKKNEEQLRLIGVLQQEVRSLKECINK
ncbi:hypothetical protein DDR33_24850 [Pararcticibacter amylolyticus]|uniref:Peptidase S74 domain-containing protein n=2 Tax=Pararcticibacter amylolyticus TaxID=2173175 RepID=A0A2U2P991_9SPHI|nr:hypothetical protein DDR33_24850 [Pararcticibacter amylolyticus]